MLPLDFYEIKNSLNDEKKLIQDSTTRFVDQEVFPGTRLTTHGGAGINFT